MDRSELLKIFDQQQRIEASFPGVIEEKTDLWIRNIMPDENQGFISYTNLDESNVDAVIDEMIAYFNSRGAGFEWKVYDHDRPADLRQRLQARGFVIEDPEALVVLDLENAPSSYWTMDTSCVVKITDEEGVDQVVKLETEVWGTDHEWLRPRLLKDLREQPELLSVFGVKVDGRLVSAAWTYYYPTTQFASLWGGSTLEDYRKRGYYTALLAARAREARERGYRFLTVDASPMSRPILEKHGFQFLGYSTPCEWKVKREENQ